MASENRAQNITAVGNLLSSVQEGRVSHAYILTGEQGYGMRTLAISLASALVCREGTRPCGECPQCKKALTGTHPDIHLFEDGADGKSVGVDRVREIGRDAYIAPSESSWSVFLFFHADRLTAQAQNALLKVFEEPPPAVVFILLTSNLLSLLPTVRSRGRIVHVPPPDPALLMTGLKQLSSKHSEEELYAAAAFSGGTASDARSVESTIEQMQWALEFFDLLTGKSRMEFMRQHGKLSKNKGVLLSGADALQKLCRDIGRAKEDCAEGWFFKGHEEKIRHYAILLTKKKLLRLQANLTRTIRLFDGTYGNASLASIVFLNRCWEEIH